MTEALPEFVLQTLLTRTTEQISWLSCNTQQGFYYFSDNPIKLVQLVKTTQTQQISPLQWLQLAQPLDWDACQSKWRSWKFSIQMDDFYRNSSTPSTNREPVRTQPLYPAVNMFLCFKVVLHISTQDSIGIDWVAIWGTAQLLASFFHPSGWFIYIKTTVHC